MKKKRPLSQHEIFAELFADSDSGGELSSDYEDEILFGNDTVDSEDDTPPSPTHTQTSLFADLPEEQGPSGDILVDFPSESDSFLSESEIEIPKRSEITRERTRKRPWRGDSDTRRRSVRRTSSVPSARPSRPRSRNRGRRVRSSDDREGWTDGDDFLPEIYLFHY